MKFNFNFNLEDRSKTGGLRTLKAIASLNTILGIVWFVFMFIGAICVGQGSLYGNVAAIKAGDAFLAFFAFVWAAVLALAIIAIITAVDLKRKYKFRTSDELLAFSVMMIFMPIIFAPFTYYSAELTYYRHEKTLETKTVKETVTTHVL